MRKRLRPSGLAGAALVFWFALGSVSEAQPSSVGDGPTAAEIQRIENDFLYSLQRVALAVDTRIHIRAVFIGSTGYLAVHHQGEHSAYKIGDGSPDHYPPDPRRETLSRFIAEQMMRLSVNPFTKEHLCVDLDFMLPARKAVPSAPVRFP